MTKESCADRIRDCLDSVEKDLISAFKLEDTEDHESDEYENLYEYLSDYALCFDYVEPEIIDFDPEEHPWADTEEDYLEDPEYEEESGYWRYQIAYGGPQYEYRFYMNQEDQDIPYKTLFWYLDWNDGAYLYPHAKIANELWHALKQFR